MNTPQPPEHQHAEPDASGQSELVGVHDFVPPVQAKQVGRLLFKLLLILLVAALVGVGTVWLLRQHHAAKPASQATSHHAASSALSKPTSPTITYQTKHYDSTNFSLSLDYPADWAIADTGGKLFVDSPAVTLTTADGQRAIGRIEFTIQPKQASLAQFSAGHAVAALESVKITYRHPTSNQRAQTYVSLVNYNGSTSSIDALYLAGDNGYQTGQAIPMTDVVQTDPLVSIGFQKCADNACSTVASALSLAAGSWNDPNLSKPLLNLLESLSIE